jgi:hypothetical protein
MDGACSAFPNGNDKVICVICNKKIRPFKNRDDWKKRLMHLKCYKEDLDNSKMEEIYKEFLKEEKIKIKN